MPPERPLKMKANTYVLENIAESERLDYQSSLPEYDFRRELTGFEVVSNGSVLDAGCGSGIVTRYLARLYPDATVTGCDVSPLRIAQAQDACATFRNIHIETQNLSRLEFGDASFDAIVCRYVLQHIPRADVSSMLFEFVRCLKPGGTLRLIDADGILVNLYPQPPDVARALKQLEAHCPVDLHSGRKIPALLHDAGFADRQVETRAIAFTGEALEHEAALMGVRLESALPMLSGILGGELAARRFRQQYLAALRAPGSFYFHTMFVGTGKKPQTF